MSDWGKVMVMMPLGLSVVGILFCLLGLAVLVAVLFFGVRYFIDYTGHGPGGERGWSRLDGRDGVSA